MSRSFALFITELAVAIIVADLVATGYLLKAAFHPGGTYSILLVGTVLSLIVGALVAKRSGTTAQRLWPPIGMITGVVTAALSLAFTVLLIGS